MRYANEHPEQFEDGDDPFDDLAELSGLSDHALARHFDFPPTHTRPARPYYLSRGRVFGDPRKGNQ